MRTLIKVALVVLGVRAFLRWRKRGHEAAEPTSATAEPAADPADELRQKLAASRGDDGALEPEEPQSLDVDDRRADVHQQGRATLGEMKSSDEG